MLVMAVLPALAVGAILHRWMHHDAKLSPRYLRQTARRRRWQSRLRRRSALARRRLTRHQRLMHWLRDLLNTSRPWS